MRCRSWYPSPLGREMQFPMLQQKLQLRSILPPTSPSACRPRGMQGGMGRLSGTQRLLPKGTLHFSAIYCVYPQPRRMALTYLHYLKSAGLGAPCGVRLWREPREVLLGKGTRRRWHSHFSGAQPLLGPASMQHTAQPRSSCPPDPKIAKGHTPPLQSHTSLSRVSFLTAPQGSASARGAPNSSKHVA